MKIELDVTKHSNETLLNLLIANIVAIEIENTYQENATSPTTGEYSKALERFYLNLKAEILRRMTK